jgi:hypothetical protein
LTNVIPRVYGNKWQWSLVPKIALPNLGKNGNGCAFDPQAKLGKSTRNTSMILENKMQN